MGEIVNPNIPTLPIRLSLIRTGLRMEAGIRRDGTRGTKMRLTGKAPSCLTICKKEFGLSARTAEKMIPLFDALLVENGYTVGE